MPGQPLACSAMMMNKVVTLKDYYVKKLILKKWILKAATVCCCQCLTADTGVLMLLLYKHKTNFAKDSSSFSLMKGHRRKQWLKEVVKEENSYQRMW
jgi:hypothetical protein